MLELLKEITRLGYLEDWPGSGEALISLLRGITCLRAGVLWAGIRHLDQVGRWHTAATQLLGKFVPEETLRNTAAELYHNDFRRDKRLLLILGVALGAQALTVPDYFATAPRFVTHVVGLRYGSRAAEAAALAPGMPVLLVREPENPHDAGAVAVLAPWGTPLGYLRRPLAAVLSARIDAGETFAARVAALCPEHDDPNARLHIEVQQTEATVRVRLLRVEGPAPCCRTVRQ